MKNLIKIVSILMMFSILMFVVSACQQGETVDPEDGNKTADNLEGQVEIPEDNDTKAEANEEEAKPQESDMNLGDLNPQVTVTEGRDYITLDKASIDFELTDLEGKTIKLSDYEGQIVFLNFWATWCPPCRAEMPDMEAIHKAYGDKGVIILGVSSTVNELQGGTDSQKAEEKVRDFIDKEGYTFSIPLDPDNGVSGDYNAIYPMRGIPTTFMIDRQGMIRFVRPGAFQGEEQMKAFIALLDE